MVRNDKGNIVQQENTKYFMIGLQSICIAGSDIAIAHCISILINESWCICRAVCTVCLYVTELILGKNETQIVYHCSANTTSIITNSIASLPTNLFCGSTCPCWVRSVHPAVCSRCDDRRDRRTSTGRDDTRSGLARRPSCLDTTDRTGLQAVTASHSDHVSLQAVTASHSDYLSLQTGTASCSAHIGLQATEASLTTLAWKPSRHHTLTTWASVPSRHHRVARRACNLKLHHTVTTCACKPSRHHKVTTRACKPSRHRAVTTWACKPSGHHRVTRWAYKPSRHHTVTR